MQISTYINITFNSLTLNEVIHISDIKKQVYELCTTVYQIKGYMKGKTLLPFPEVILLHTWI